MRFFAVKKFQVKKEKLLISFIIKASIRERKLLFTANKIMI